MTLNYHILDREVSGFERHLSRLRIVFRKLALENADMTMIVRMHAMTNMIVYHGIAFSGVYSPPKTASASFRNS